MKRKILLIEPNYKNKYPPIGLMKLATYHKMLGDEVVFFKGELKDFLIRNITEHCILKLYNIEASVNWRSKYFIIQEYIRKRNKSLIDDLKLSDLKYKVLILDALNYYKDFYWKKEYLKEKYWDRICVTTLFTFHWNITIKTIEFCKQLVKNENELWVGGVMASVIPDEIKKETGLKNIHSGLLNIKGILDKNDIVIDELPLDYSILEEIDYKYPENNAYYGYTTRGCVRKCDFCAVPVIEPKFVNRIELTSKVNGVNEKFGSKRNLLLLDNNVLASPRFERIINEIRENGFDKKTKFIEPNQLEISLNNLNAGINDRGYIKKIVFLLNEMIEKLKGEQRQDIYNIILENNLIRPETASKDVINKVVPELLLIYEKHRNKVPKQRYVDFNQGVDARLLTDDKAKLLSKIPIRPLRIAFDSMDYEEYYLNAIIKAKKYGIRHFSNYLLYNHKEKPIDLYQRLKINVELCDKYKIDIYSFPMKFHPIFGDYHLNRDFIGTYWNRKFIRAVQVILNATKGKIGKGKSFFYKAFGANEEEYNELLYMPETYLLFRFFFEKEGMTDEWRKAFNALTMSEIEVAKDIIERNDFRNIDNYKRQNSIYRVLKHYTITREDITDSNSELSKLKTIFDNLAKEEKYGIMEQVECL